MIVKEPLKDGSIMYYSRVNKLLLDETTGKKYTVYIQEPRTEAKTFVEIDRAETNEDIIPVVINSQEDFERYEL